MFATIALLAALTVTTDTCPKCPCRMKLSPNADTVTINLAKVSGEGEKAALVKRAEMLAAMAADTRNFNSKTRPLMGWSSWNTFGLDISEDIILGVARAMATNGLAAAGYRYVNIDDGFFNGHDPQTGKLRMNLKRFPNGMKPVVDGIHALGLKAGTYSDAGANTCGSGRDPGGKGAGLYGHDQADCELHFKELGFDFFKVDYCGGRRLKLDERQRYTEISKAIRATGRDVHFNVCRWAYPGTWISDVADSWRVTGDIRARWSLWRNDPWSVKGILNQVLYLSAYVSPGHYNDLDMLEVGQIKGQTRTSFGKDDPGLTAEEEATHFGMWCMLSSPLMMGCDVRTLAESSKALATNPFVLAMSQNDLGLAGYIVQHEGEAYVFVKDADRLYGTARFVALCNLGDRPHDFKVDFRTLDLGGEVAAFDLVERGDLGVCEGTFRMTVPAHGTRFLRLDAEKRLERTVYEAETAFLTDYQALHDATKAGTAFPNGRAGASGGVVVGFLGRRASNDLVWKNVHLMQDGEVTLEFTVTTYGTRTFDVQIDGGAPTRLVVKDQKPYRKVSVKKHLKAGDHVVRLSNATDWMPDVDKMTIIRAEEDKAPAKAYLFSYFSNKGFGGRSCEAAGLHLAWLTDGKKWTALKNDQPFIVPHAGRDKLMRDPSICVGPDGVFHLVWTTSWKDR